MNNVHKSFLYKTHSKLYNEQLSDSTDFLKINLENKFYFVGFVVKFIRLCYLLK